ncbi:MAG: DUF4153 domain-containing protein [Clostridiales bacterium]|nr:DUF4153 domain-containing protein [Clostridiales bacterium]
MKEKKTFLEVIKTLGVKLFNGLKRYPVSIGMGAAASVIGVILIHSENISKDNERLLASFIMALVIGFLFSLSVKTFIENNETSMKIRWFLWIVVGTFSLFYSIYLYSNMENNEMFEMVRFAAMLLAGFVLFMTAVFRKKTENQEVYSTLSGWRLAITIIYTLIIWGGISLILFAIDELLGIYIDEKAYLDTIVLTTGFFSPMFFFGGIPKTDEKLTPEKIYKFFKILVVYVIAPLLTAYTVVFYIYALRILFSWDWPDGIVGNMVLWYAIIGTVTMYFLSGMDGESKWASIFGKWFPRVIILPIVLLFIALIIRINAYGFTANRYFLGVVGIWTLGCALYMSIVNYKKRCTRAITVSLVIIALLSVIGPWNAINVGRISQTNRFEKLLIKNNLLVNGQTQQNPDLSKEIKGEISEMIVYLERNYDSKKVDFLPEGFEQSDMKDVFGFEYTYYYEDLYLKENPMDVSIRQDKLDLIIDVRGYDYIWDSEHWEMNFIEIDEGELGIEFLRDENVNDLIITLDDEPLYEKNIDSFLVQIQETWDEKGNDITLDELTFTDETSDLRLKIVFTAVEMFPDNNGFELGWVRFFLLIKMK